MKRFILQDLAQWKTSHRRKPLILKGARQVGKTFILKEFGKEYFIKQKAAFHYIDLKEEKELHSVFSETNNPKNILKAIQLHTHKKINPDKDLLILDEIQDCSKAIGSLKYFEQSMNKLAVIAAGSHMGLVANAESFPIGKVTFLYMFPMTFAEFLLAFDEMLYQEFEQCNIAKTIPLPTLIHNKLLEVLRYYFVIGGLPEVVHEFVTQIKTNELAAISRSQTIQKDLVEGYQADFSKYSGTINANHIHRVFQSIPTQLSKAHDTEVNRYKFSGVIPKQKGFDRIAGPLHWLEQSRLCIKTFIASKATTPLSGHCQENKFKVYFFDIGLLNCLLRTPPTDILQDRLGSYKGYIAENFVAQELFAKINAPLFSWHEGSAEVEFIVSGQKGLMPLEVKASSKSRQAKSLDSYIQRYKPKTAYKMSGQNLGTNQKKQTTLLPLYLCSKLKTA